jgi:S1-C subfamily serine protease
VAELSGGRIRRGDTILAIQGEKVTSRQDLIRLASKLRSAPVVDVQVRSPQGVVQVVRIAVPGIAGAVAQ